MHFPAKAEEYDLGKVGVKAKNNLLLLLCYFCYSAWNICYIVIELRNYNYEEKYYN